MILFYTNLVRQARRDSFDNTVVILSKVCDIFCMPKIFKIFHNSYLSFSEQC